MKASHATTRRNAESHFTGGRPERERNPLGAGNARSHMRWEMIKVVGALEREEMAPWLRVQVDCQRRESHPVPLTRRSMKRVKSRSRPVIPPRRGRAATPKKPRTTERFIRLSS